MDDLERKKSKDRERKARLRQDRKCYHVTAVLSPAESDACMKPPLAREVAIEDKDGRAVTLTLGWQPEPHRRK